MKRYFFTKLILSLTIIPCYLAAEDLVSSSAEDMGMSSVQLEKIDKAMQRYIDDNRLVDIDVLVARKGKIVYNRSFSKDKTKHNRPSLYRIASMTKPITSVAIMILVERGKLKLSDPISRYMPEFKNMKVLIDDDAANVSNSEKSNAQSAKPTYHLIGAKREITVEDLLTHTSGIIYSFRNEKYLTDLYKNAGVSDGLSDNKGLIGDNVKKIAQLPLKHQPGQHFTYGLSVDVLGYLVEVISGRSLAQFFKDKILDPLQMNDTHFYLAADDYSRLVPLYMPDENGGIRKIDDKKDKVSFVSFFKYTGSERYYSGGAGLVSSTHDYARFLQMMIYHGELNGMRILSGKTVELMFTNHVQQIEQGDNNFRFGLGFEIHNKPTTAQDLPEGSLSWAGIFHTSFWIDPKNEIVGVSMAQKFPAPKSDVHKVFSELVYAALKDK